MPGLTFDGGPDVLERAREIVDGTTLSPQESDLAALLDEGEPYDPAALAETIETSRGTVDVVLTRIREKRRVARATVEATSSVPEGKG